LSVAFRDMLIIPVGKQTFTSLLSRARQKYNEFEQSRTQGQDSQYNEPLQQQQGQGQYGYGQNQSQNQSQNQGGQNWAGNGGSRGWYAPGGGRGTGQAQGQGQGLWGNTS
jgi:hypothetical protein